MYLPKEDEKYEARTLSRTYQNSLVFSSRSLLLLLNTTSGFASFDERASEYRLCFLVL